MPTLVIRRNQLLFVAHHSAAALRTGHHAINSLIEGLVRNGLLVDPRGQQGRFVKHVGQICTRETRGFSGQHSEVDALGHRLALGVNLKNLLSALHVRGIDLNLTVKTSRTQQRRVQNIGAVSRSNQNHVGFGIKTIHLHEQLVERLFALVVTAAHASPTVSSNSINLVHEDDGRRVLFGLFEQVANTRGANADKHFDKVRTGDGIERNVGFASNGPGQQCLSGPWRAVEQDALGNLRAHLQELLRVLEELLDFVKFFNGFIRTSNVLKRDR